MGLVRKFRAVVVVLVVGRAIQFKAKLVLDFIYCGRRTIFSLLCSHSHTGIWPVILFALLSKFILTL